ncbi:MAG TPA: hypothetical protein VGK59_22330 [Ohtaekwangia sp.]
MLVFLGVTYNSVFSQELFPNNEPASTMPNGVTGIRFTEMLHYKYDTWGHREALRFMYGLTPKVTVMLSTYFSNFHVNSFPENLNLYYSNYHNHQSDESSYPYQFEGIHLYSKWRFFSKDRTHKHFRLALFGEFSYITSVHIDAFPSLMGDNSGMGFGIIATTLHNKMAVSITGGFNNFFSYEKTGSDTIAFKAGNAININLSLGYLLFPRSYKNYSDLNFNLYLETNFRVYQGPYITRNGYTINSDQFSYLKGGSLLFLYPGIQFIVNSKTRIDLSMETPVYFSEDLDRFTMGIITLQRYFYK